MLIGKKFNLLILGVILAIFIAIGVFIINYIPVVNMRAEKDKLTELNTSISELRADINKIALSTFKDQIELIKHKNDLLTEQFSHIDSFTALKSNEEIEESLRIIGRLYTLYEVNYERLNAVVEPLTLHFMDIFLSSSVKMQDVKESALLIRHKDAEAVQAQLDSLFSIITILDSNLISTHTVVVEQFEVIDTLIDYREVRSYVSGLILVLFTALLAFVSAFIIASRITRNIHIVGGGIERMSTGDISEVFDIKSEDEIGELGRNLNTLTDSLKSAFNSMKSGSNRGVELKEELISSANQTSAAATEIAGNSQEIAEQFKVLSEKVLGAAEANHSLKNSLQSLDGHVQEQTAMVEESTSAVTQMISSINNVNDITTRKRAATDTLVKTAETGGSKLAATIKIITEINQSLDQIKGAATIIQQIASQTNLLAMNAAIEAAHAGDAGRGFAVVADEIRKLAEASSINSKQINGVLKEVVSRIEVASASGKETESAFIEIDREVGGVAQSLDEISSSMSELNIGGKQILEAMTGLQDVSVHVNQGSHEMTDASEKVTSAIEVVSRITTVVSNSTNEITVGITEVSDAMMLVTELSGSLGDITDTLEREAACFKTEEDDVLDGACSEPVSGENLEEIQTQQLEKTEATDSTEVTLSDADTDLEIELIE